MATKNNPYSKAAKAAESEAKAIKENQEGAYEASDPSFVLLPFGKFKKARPYREIRDKFLPQDLHLLHPEEIVKDTELRKGWRLAWPDKTAYQTQANINAGVYVPVTKNDLRSDARVKVTHAGTDDNVYWYNHILVWICPEEAERLYELPEELAISRLARQDEAEQERFERAGHKDADVQYNVTREVR